MTDRAQKLYQNLLELADDEDSPFYLIDHNQVLQYCNNTYLKSGME